MTVLWEKKRIRVHQRQNPLPKYACDTLAQQFGLDRTIPYGTSRTFPLTQKVTDGYVEYFDIDLRYPAVPTKNFDNKKRFRIGHQTRKNAVFGTGLFTPYYPAWFRKECCIPDTDRSTPSKKTECFFPKMEILVGGKLRLYPVRRKLIEGVDVEQKK